MIQYVLLHAQAAGLAANIWQTSKQNRLDTQATRLQQQVLSMRTQIQQRQLEINTQQQQQNELDIRMEQESLVSAQESVADLERLRDIMSTQRAIVAARGQSMQGSNYLIGQQTVQGFNADEQAGKLSLGFRKYYYKANQNLLGIEQKINSNLLELGKNVNSSLLEMGRKARKGERQGELIKQGVNMMSSNSFASLFDSDGGVNHVVGKINNMNTPFSGSTGTFGGRKGQWVTGTNISNSWRNLGKKSWSGLNG